MTGLVDRLDLTGGLTRVNVQGWCHAGERSEDFAASSSTARGADSDDHIMNTRGWRNVLIAWFLLTGTAWAENFWGLTTNDTLVRFTSSAPGTLLASLPITGLPDGERIVAIEVLEPEGTFVGVSTAGRFYALDRRRRRDGPQPGRTCRSNHRDGVRHDRSRRQSGGRFE
jgi:hypothetical protein